MSKLLSLMLLGVLVGCASTGPSQDVPGPLTLTFTNGHFLEITTCDCPMLNWGGLDREWNWREEVLASQPTIPLLSLAGGPNFVAHPRASFKSDPATNQKRAQIFVDALNEMKYKALGISTEDLHLGLNALSALESRAHFPFVNANLVYAKNKKPVFRPFVEFTLRRVPFTVVGLSRQSKTGPQFEVLPPEVALTQVLKERKNPKSVVIVLASLTNEERSRIQEIPEVNLILGGDGIESEELSDVKQLAPTRLLASPSFRGRAILRFDLQFPNPFAGFQSLFNADVTGALMYEHSKLDGELGSNHPRVTKLHQLIEGTYATPGATYKPQLIRMEEKYGQESNRIRDLLSEIPNSSH